MKTTLDLHDALLIKAKAVAARERTSLTRLIEEGLTLRLRPPLARRRQSQKALPVYRGSGGLAATVADPASNRSLLDATDVSKPGTTLGIPYPSNNGRNMRS